MNLSASVLSVVTWPNQLEHWLEDQGVSTFWAFVLVFFVFVGARKLIELISGDSASKKLPPSAPTPVVEPEEVRPPTVPVEYHIFRDDAQQGPFTIGQLRSMWASGSITADTFYWVEGAPDWIPLRTLITQLEEPQQPSPTATSKREYPARSVPAVQPARRVVAGTPTPVVLRPPKSRGVFIILGLLLGWFGIHNFYAGYYRRGVWQLVLTVLLCWTVVVLIGVAIWVIVELCTVTDDADSTPFV